MELFYSLIWMNIRFISITLWFYHLFSWACIQNFKFINLLHNKYPKLIEYSKTFYNAIEWFINFLFEKLDFNKGIHPLLFTGIITFLMVLLKWHYNKKTEKINKLKDFQATVEEYNKYIGDYSNGEKEFSIKKENNRFIFSSSSEIYDILFDGDKFYYYNEHLQRILIGYASLYYRGKININNEEKPYYIIEGEN